MLRPAPSPPLPPSASCPPRASPTFPTTRASRVPALRAPEHLPPPPASAKTSHSLAPPSWSQVKDRLAETKYQALNAKEELEQLRAQIVPDPKKLKQELQALQEAVAHEKENVRQVEASGCEASRQLEASERAEREMEAVLHGQARTARPPHPPTHHPPTMHPPCTHHDPP